MDPDASNRDPCNDDDDRVAARNRALLRNSAMSVLEQMEQNYQTGLLRRLAHRKASPTPSSPTPVSVVSSSSPSPSLPSPQPPLLVVSAPTTPPTKENKETMLAGEEKKKENEQSPPLSSSPKSPSQQEFQVVQEKNPTRRLLTRLKNQDKKKKKQTTLNITDSVINTKEEALKMTVQYLSDQLDQVSKERTELKSVVKDLLRQLADQTAKVQALEFHFTKMNEAALHQQEQEQQHQHRRVGSLDGSVSETADMSESYSDSFSGDSSLCCSFDCYDDNQSLATYEQQQVQVQQQQQAQQELQECYGDDSQVVETIEAVAPVPPPSPPPPVEKLSVSFQSTGAKLRMAKLQAAEKRSQLTCI